VPGGLLVRDKLHRILRRLHKVEQGPNPDRANNCRDQQCLLHSVLHRLPPVVMFDVVPPELKIPPDRHLLTRKGYRRSMKKT
jgi:hypothetical protein